MGLEIIKREIKNSPDPKWNDRILFSKHGRYQQTTFHADFLQKYRKFKPIYVYFKNEETIVGQQLIFLRPRGTTTTKKFISKLIRKEPSYFWKNSVLIFDNSYQDEILQSFTSLIKEKEYSGTDTPNVDYHLKLDSKLIGTLLIDIKDSFEETISGRDPTSTQKHIAMAAHQGIPTKKGVTAKKIQTDDEIRIYHKMLNEHRKFLKIDTIYNFESLKDRIMTLSKNGHGGALLAYHKNKPISGITYILFNGWIQNSNVANTRYSLEKKLSSLDHLRCCLISIGVKNSAGYFDVGGITLEPKNPKETSINHSQKKWGGKEVKYKKYLNV